MDAKPHIGAEEYGTFQEAPRRKVGALLLNGQVTVTYLHHIHVIVSKGPARDEYT